MLAACLLTGAGAQLITDVIIHTETKNSKISIGSKSGISPPSALRSRTSYLSDAYDFASLKQQMAVCCLQSRN